MTQTQVPVIDIDALVKGEGDLSIVTSRIDSACRDNGFFYIVNHGVNLELQNELERVSRIFFSLDKETKMKIRMELGGRFWRGYFPLGDELTSGKPDLKEGIYFGSELPLSHPLVKAHTPMHGPNLFPDVINFRETVLEYMTAMTHLGHVLMEGISLALNLDRHYFRNLYTGEPLTLFRIFHYPHVPGAAAEKNDWGVGAHTDYGLLTILKQDEVGGLQVKSKDSWIEAPPLENTFVVNIGDMLDKVTGGLYRSTLHRVVPAKKDRLSFPFFFDPNFFSRVEPVREVLSDDGKERWDKTSVHEFNGTYGDYLLGKVSKVFPQLKSEIT